MNILEQIIAHKKTEVAASKSATPVSVLEMRPLFKHSCHSLRPALQANAPAIIAEYKRKSPSKGVINETTTVSEVTSAYAAFGAAAISILTDNHFFGGSTADLESARQFDVPLLQKDFIIDEYQVIEAKAIGADIILLIAACLSPMEVRSLSRLAQSLGMEVLLEIHALEELDHVSENIGMVGVNNRNLKNFEVNLEHSMAIASQINDDKFKIAESGLHSVADVHLLQKAGFSGFLIGEYFMKQADPAITFKTFMSQL